MQKRRATSHTERVFDPGDKDRETCTEGKFLRSITSRIGFKVDGVMSIPILALRESCAVVCL
jgi:hypothetical protein